MYKHHLLVEPQYLEPLDIIFTHGFVKIMLTIWTPLLATVVCIFIYKKITK